jgi:hypothetical protein
MSDEALQPYRRLAVRVLACAFLDLANPRGPAGDRESARAFLAGSGMLIHWCRVAALDPSRIVRHAEKLAAGGANPVVAQHEPATDRRLPAAADAGLRLVTPFRQSLSG